MRANILKNRGTPFKTRPFGHRNHFSREGWRRPRRGPARLRAHDCGCSRGVRGLPGARRDAAPRCATASGGTDCRTERTADSGRPRRRAAGPHHLPGLLREHHRRSAFGAHLRPSRHGGFRPRNGPRRHWPGHSPGHDLHGPVHGPAAVERHELRGDRPRPLPAHRAGPGG